MYCPRCKKEVFGGGTCHVCGGPLVEKGEITELSPSKPTVKIATRKKYKVSREFGQTLPGRIGRLFVEIVIFCVAFILLSTVIVSVANWLSKEMALPGKVAQIIDIHSRWMKYFWYIGCGAIVFLTVKLRFKPGK
jgi:hypothetical protein